MRSCLPQSKFSIPHADCVRLTRGLFSINMKAANASRLLCENGSNRVDFCQRRTIANLCLNQQYFKYEGGTYLLRPLVLVLVARPIVSAGSNRAENS